jgi:exodeoxyribonuclease-3
MKLKTIATWNVNGIRASLRNGFLDWLQSESPDVVCLQEVKAYESQVDVDFSKLGYQAFWNSAERAGYSGVLTFSKITPQEIQLGLEEEQFNNEGRAVRLRFDSFYLYNVYFPNGQRGHDRVEYKLNFYFALLAECKKLLTSGQNVIITGDFNTAHQEIDLANPKENQNTSGFMPEEREVVSEYLASGFEDVFRNLYPDLVKYTWWTYRFQARKRNIGWRLDYYLVNSAFSAGVEDVVVMDDVLGSDHCPVVLKLKND